MTDQSKAPISPEVNFPRRVSQWTICKEFKFAASHVLSHHQGKCSRLHGHNWKLRVYIRGNALSPSGSDTDMLVDFDYLKQIVGELVDTRLDHQHLNDSIGTIERVSPTCEVLAFWIYSHLTKKLDLSKTEAKLIAVEIEETDTSMCRYEEVPA